MHSIAIIIVTLSGEDEKNMFKNLQATRRTTRQELANSYLGMHPIQFIGGHG